VRNLEEIGRKDMREELREGVGRDKEREESREGFRERRRRRVKETGPERTD